MDTKHDPHYYDPDMSREEFLQKLKKDAEFSPGWQISWQLMAIQTLSLT